MKEIKVKIDNIDYKVKRTNRSLMFFENYTKKSIDELSGTMTDILTLFYCVLHVNNENFNFSFEDFCDILDEYPQVFSDFQQYLIELNLDVTSEEEQPKKKVTTKKPK